ncbi:hypothetical protein DFH29DRAFT_890445 [Suillus ampliporus]|nr:hypothetical protein DFH29DRAFT_890445 [Suillus ampliporus]
MFVITPVHSSNNYNYHPHYHHLDPYVAQQRAEHRARAEARIRRHRQEQLRQQLIIDALHAQQYDQYDHTDFPYYDYIGACPPQRRNAAFNYEAAIQQARRQAVLEQAAREREARLQEYRHLATLQAHREEQELHARRRADVEKFFNAFLRPTQNVSVNPVCSFSSNNSPSRNLLQSQELPPQPIASTSKAPVQDHPALKERLEERLMAEYESDVRDALQSLLSSVSEGTPTDPPVERVPAASAAASLSGSTQLKVNDETSTVQDKGKAKAKEIPDSDSEEEPSASPAQVASSLSQITSIASRLESLIANFQFPAELDFSPSRSPSAAYSALDTSDVFALTYTATNAPLRAQEHALSSLLADLDNVPSYGSHVVRDARRAVVARVEQALEELEKGVEERRGRARARKTDPVSVPVQQPPHPMDVPVDASPSEPENNSSEDLAPIQVPVADEVSTKDFVSAEVSVPVEALAPGASSPIETIADLAVPSETIIEAPATFIPISIEIATASVAEPSLASSASLPTTTSQVSETLTAQISVPQEELSKESEEPLVDEVSTVTEAPASEDVNTPIHVELEPSSSATRSTPPTSDSLSKNTIGVSLSVSLPDSPSSVIPDSMTLTHADADSPAEVANATNVPGVYPPAATSFLTSEQTPSQVQTQESDSESYSTMESSAPSSPVSDAEVDTFLLPASRPGSPRLVPRHSESEDEGEVVVENEEDEEWSDVAA